VYALCGGGREGDLFKQFMISLPLSPLPQTPAEHTFCRKQNSTISQVPFIDTHLQQLACLFSDSSPQSCEVAILSFSIGQMSTPRQMS
jgi:hypothetical protein